MPQAETLLFVDIRFWQQRCFVRYDWSATHTTQIHIHEFPHGFNIRLLTFSVQHRNYISKIL